MRLNALQNIFLLHLSSALAFSAGACDSSGGACTLIGCAIDGLTATLVGSDGGAAPAGLYTVTAVAGQDTRSCVVAVPDDGAASACRLFVVPGSDGPLGAHWFGFAPATVTVTVTRDGTTVGELVDFAPQYATNRPNGADCGPVCRVGPAIVTIPN